MVVTLPPAIANWFAARGWQPRAHQLAMLDAAAQGRHVLLSAPTGAGKTLAGFLPVLADLAAGGHEGLHTIYVSPLKALAVDVQRNLLGPVAEMGLPIRIETRTGDTPSDRKARQRAQPPHILLTTPESLALLLSYPDAPRLLGGVKSIIIDEIHAFGTTKRGDQLSLCLARLQALAPAMRRIGLSATIADPQAWASWLAPDADAGQVDVVASAPGATPDIDILVVDDRIPWGGHNGRWAARAVMRQIERARLAIVFVNTRAVAELVFRDLWAENDQALPIGIHHGSLAPEARRKVEAAMAAGRLRAIVATASLDLGLDWGDVDLVIQMGAPKGASRLVQRTGRANHRMDEVSRCLVVPGNRFEYLEALAARDAVLAGEHDPDGFRPGALDVLAQHVLGCAAAAPFHPDELYAEVTGAAPYAGLARAEFDRVLGFASTGGYALKAYEQYRKLVPLPDGRLRLARPQLAQSWRMNSGTIVEAATMNIVLGRGRGPGGRRIGRVEEYFAGQLRVGDSFMFAGQVWQVQGFDGADVQVLLGRGSPKVPVYAGGWMPLSTHLAARVQALFRQPNRWAEMPADVAEWLRLQAALSRLPQPGRVLVETFPRDGRWHMLVYGFAGHPAHQTLGMLLTQRMEAAGLQPLGFLASDYALAVWSLDEVRHPAPLFNPEVLAEELADWLAKSPFLRRAFREVAIIAGLVERMQPGVQKTGRAISASTDLIYEVLKKHEPGHLLLDAAWADARHKLTDIDRLASLLALAHTAIDHVVLDQVSPLAVPVLVALPGRESVGEAAEATLLAEAEAMAHAAFGGAALS